MKVTVFIDSHKLEDLYKAVKSKEKHSFIVYNRLALCRVSVTLTYKEFESMSKRYECPWANPTKDAQNFLCIRKNG